MRKFFSVAIPTWEINGKGVEYLDFSLNIIAQQTFKDFEVVVSDHSKNTDIEELCVRWNKVMPIKYYRNENGRGKIAPNLNNAIRKSDGQYIKILFQDDFLYDVDSLEAVYEAIMKNKDSHWFVTSCVHTDDGVTMYNRMTPHYHDRIYAGVNTISCPTVLTIKNEDPLLFDESLNWLVDCVYYKELHSKYGLPVVVDHVCAVNRNAEVRTTNMMTDSQKQEEINRVIERYEKAQ